MTLVEKILDFIEDNYPTEVRTDWEHGCAYALDQIEKLCKAEIKSQLKKGEEIYANIRN